LHSQRIAKATGATIALSLASAEGGAEFSPTYLGKAESVAQVWHEIVFVLFLF
jgi:hypothetical protein